MAEDFSVRLVERNEGVVYGDAFGTYRFALAKRRRQWTVLLPPTRSSGTAPADPSAEEARVLPRVVQYLARIRWFGLFPFTYTVTVERHRLPSSEDCLKLLEEEGWIREVRADGIVVYVPPKLSMRERMRLLARAFRAIVGR